MLELSTLHFVLCLGWDRSHAPIPGCISGRGGAFTAQPLSTEALLKMGEGRAFLQTETQLTPWLQFSHQPGLIDCNGTRIHWSTPGQCWQYK